MFKKAWQGKERLWKVFWIYRLIPAFFWVAIDFYVYARFDPDAPLSEILGAILLFVGLGWSIWLYVSLWRCAFNARWVGWGYIVRIFLILEVVWMAVQIADSFHGVFL